ncbi:hypothetical protein J6590_098571 [Homalodisca vitripennis]|nr:hypothetical protein J6590_098571 [Homalodisca vitripennis]
MLEKRTALRFLNVASIVGLLFGVSAIIRKYSGNFGFHGENASEIPLTRLPEPHAPPPRQVRDSEYNPENIPTERTGYARRLLWARKHFQNGGNRNFKTIYTDVMNCRSISVCSQASEHAYMTHTKQPWTGCLRKPNTAFELCLVIVDAYLLIVFTS